MKTVTLTDQEFAALAGLIDAAVKTLGLRAVKDAAAILKKLEDAQVSAESEPLGQEK